jgi:hypothetical protein
LFKVVLPIEAENHVRISRRIYEDECQLQAAPIRTVFSVITDFLASEPTPEQIIAYRLPPDLEARAHELLDRNGEGDSPLTKLRK